MSKEIDEGITDSPDFTKHIEIYEKMWANGRIDPTDEPGPEENPEYDLFNDPLYQKLLKRAKTKVTDPEKRKILDQFEKLAKRISEEVVTNETTALARTIEKAFESGDMSLKSVSDEVIKEAAAEQVMAELDIGEDAAWEGVNWKGVRNMTRKELVDFLREELAVPEEENKKSNQGVFIDESPFFKWAHLYKEMCSKEE